MGNSSPPVNPTSHHCQATAPRNGVRGSKGPAGLPSTTPLQRLTKELGKTLIPGSHGVNMGQVFGEHPTQAPTLQVRKRHKTSPGLQMVSESQVSMLVSGQLPPAAWPAQAAIKKYHRLAVRMELQ